MTVATPRRNAALVVACGGSFLAFLDVTIANLALPAVGLDFAVDDIADLSWIVTLYTVVFAALLAPAGRIADVVGRRRLFLVGMAVFVVGSLGAAAAPGLGLLLAARAVQGPAAPCSFPRRWRWCCRASRANGARRRSACGARPRPRRRRSARRWAGCWWTAWAGAGCSASTSRSAAGCW